jgi:hypothetical protein
MPVFKYGLIENAKSLAKAKQILEKYNPDGSPKAGDLGGTLGQLLEKHRDETGSGISLDFPAGNVTVEAIGEPEEPTVHLLEDILAEEREEALATVGNSKIQIVSLVQAYREFVRGEIEGLVEEFRIDDKSWTFTWEKVLDIIREDGGTGLTETVDLFDELVRLEYSGTYDPMAYNRGEEVKKDPAASTFYSVMEPHLHRAIMRKDKDAWY